MTSPSVSGMAIEQIASNPNLSPSSSSSSLPSLDPYALMVNTPAMALATIKPETRVTSNSIHLVVLFKSAGVFTANMFSRKTFM